MANTVTTFPAIKIMWPSGYYPCIVKPTAKRTFVSLALLREAREWRVK